MVKYFLIFIKQICINKDERKRYRIASTLLTDFDLFAEQINNKNAIQIVILIQADIKRSLTQ